MIPSQQFATSNTSRREAGAPGGRGQKGGETRDKSEEEDRREEASFGGHERTGSAPVPLCHNWELQLESGRLN